MKKEIQECGCGRDYQGDKKQNTETNSTHHDDHINNEDHTMGGCSGVFSPVCCPGVCNVPRKRHKVDVVVGFGTFDNEVESPEEEKVAVGECPERGDIEFNLNIFKEFGKYQGEVCIIDFEAHQKIHSKTLVCIKSDFVKELVAVFRVEPVDGGSHYFLTVSARPQLCESKAKFFAYAAPLCNTPVNLGGTLKTGEIVFVKQEETEH